MPKEIKTHQPAEGDFYVETTLSKEKLLPLLEKWSPWRMEVTFSNGVSTSDLSRGEIGWVYNQQPLRKLAMLKKHLSFEKLSGKRVLDIGFNLGYNSIHLAANYGMEAVGLDVSEHHKEVAEFLAGLSNVQEKTQFRLGDATFYVEPEGFDFVLHFGTLYHLPNPFLSLENSMKSLRPGGYLALETACYNGEDPTLCKFIRQTYDDTTNFWALSKPVIEEMLELYGAHDVRIVQESEPMNYKELSMSRVLFLAQKG